MDHNRRDTKKKKISPSLSLFLAVFCLLCVLFLLFGDVLFSPGEKVLSRLGLDLSEQFLYFRDFGFRQWRQGNLALWNPHLFSGSPFLGGFQSALLYPLNVLFLFLPLASAVNLSIILHAFLLSLFTLLWARSHGLSVLASFLAALFITLSGTHYLHIYAGHLTNLCAMAWIPLIFLSLEQIGKSPNRGWIFVAILAITMEILSGHPQYVYYTAMVATLYFFVLFGERPKIAFLCVAIIVVFGAASLSAVQLLTGWEAARESVRSGGVPFEFARMFSLPPENLLTLLFPWSLGDMVTFPYWGRCYLWEMSLFFSVSGFFLGLYGFFYGDSRIHLRVSLMVLVSFVLALGVHTPLYPILYKWLPGFGSFRGTAKFAFFGVLFLALLSAQGFDALMEKGRKTNIFAFFVFVLGILLIVFAFLMPTIGRGFFVKFMELIESSGESYLNAALYHDANFQRAALNFARHGLVVTGGLMVLLGILFYFARLSKMAVYSLVLVACLELIFFAQRTTTNFPLSAWRESGLADFFREHPGDYRILNLYNPNSAMVLNTYDIWGYDPYVSKRYAEFLTFLQGYDPDRASQYLTFIRYHPLFQMLRLRYVVVRRDKGYVIEELPTPFPRVMLFRDYKVIRGRDGIFRELLSPHFDPRKTVILEKEPRFRPKGGAPKGEVSYKVVDTDTLLIEASLPEEAILVITDGYSKGWRIRHLRERGDGSLEVIPANYVLLAVPLPAGAHRLLLEYKPAGFLIGEGISLISLGLYFLLLTFYGAKEFVKRSE